MTNAELDPGDGVVVTADSDYFHRCHPSMLMHLACNPEVRGTVARYEEVEDEREACGHASCFGGAHADD